ncbi:LysM peptidoglycan-binding domain-containing protein [Paenibacillus sp. P25]|nr:LysM peptidoglycan-binding domain-containing protein [Paenibacillus sp. P25]
MGIGMLLRLPNMLRRFELCNRCAGDTLWAIASEHKRKGQDVRDYVDEILKVNGLKSPSLRVGQKLLLP